MAIPERLLYIEVIVVSIRTRVLGRFIACGCSLEVVVWRFHCSAIFQMTIIIDAYECLWSIILHMHIQIKIKC